MKWLAAILASLLLAACGGNLQMPEMLRYDIGNPGGKGPAPGLSIAAVDVQAASWLFGPAMHYRLAYAEPLRRQTYAESAWVAPPGELLEAFLMRRLALAQTDFSGTGCRLQLVLDELEQRFDAPQRSQIALEVRALLLPPKGDELLSRRVFMISKATTAPDARGGAAAARAAALALADEIGVWLGETSRDKPAIVGRCLTR